MAATVACREIHARLVAKAASMLGVEAASVSIEGGRVLVSGKQADLGWEKLVMASYESRIDLSAHGFYSTPGLFYDMKAEWGSPFAYHVYGAACVEATVDTLRGSYVLDRATIVHDMGKCLDIGVDIGQIEGALAQGLGWALLEDLQFAGSGGVPVPAMPASAGGGGAAGKLLADTLSTYKLPDIHFMPQEVDIEFLPVADGPSALMRSKAVGEPPLIYGIAGYFAVLDAMRVARKDGPGLYDIPLTPEKVLDYVMGVKP
jgi:xanthine dehydrogenase large subunit